ncbi:hypothetical protein ROSA5918_10925 [Roseateles saccharophilus]|uniref:Uncharacterized protein n=1 Tax=Roseateles saccharophilus TaxID=304 RepID=A0A4R3UZF8_ROSSA|nr:hypothetical protein EV671_101566 [Roseateles saccharophilus]
MELLILTLVLSTLAAMGLLRDDLGGNIDAPAA